MDLRGKRIEEGYTNLVTVEGDSVASSGKLQNGQGTDLGNIAVGGLSFNSGDSELQLPAGTTAERPASPSAGYARFNTDNGKVEIYTGAAWLSIALEGAVQLEAATATVTANDAVAVISTFIGQFGTPAAAYSVRKLGSVTNAIRVRRSSDNAEQDIGFTSGDDLDESALTTFVGANDGFVTTWYDQSGNGNNATQSTAGSQPKIVSSGSVIKESSVPALDFDGGGDILDISTGIPLTTDNSLFFVTTSPSNSQSYIVSNTDGAGSSPAIIANYVGTSIELLHNISSQEDRYDFVSSITNGTQVLLSYVIDNQTSGTTFADGAQGETFTPVANMNGTKYNRIGAGSNALANLSDVKIQELIVYNSDKSADRTDIESDIATYYNITI